MAIIPVLAEIMDLLLANPLLAWLTVISAFAVDSWISNYVKFQGVGGWVATQAIQFLTGNHEIVVTSFEILVLIVVFPIIVFALQKSRQNVGR
jgi:hypothetical protein